MDSPNSECRPAAGRTLAKDQACNSESGRLDGRLETETRSCDSHQRILRIASGVQNDGVREDEGMAVAMHAATASLAAVKDGTGIGAMGGLIARQLDGAVPIMVIMRSRGVRFNGAWILCRKCHREWLHPQHKRQDGHHKQARRKRTAQADTHDHRL